MDNEKEFIKLFKLIVESDHQMSVKRQLIEFIRKRHHEPEDKQPEDTKKKELKKLFDKVIEIITKN